MGQATQVVVPVLGWYRPAVQLEQVEDARNGWKLPLAQLEHELAEAEEYLPAAQAEQVVAHALA